MLVCSLSLASGKNILADQIPKYGPIGTPYAVPLSQDHKYFQNSNNTAFDFWNLAPFYIP
jgi:hypothetical protein